MHKMYIYFFHRTRGVNPSVAQALHKEFLPLVVDQAMREANVAFNVSSF